MNEIDRRRKKVINGIPQESKEFLISERLIVAKLAERAKKNFSGGNPFQITDFQNELRDIKHPHLSITLNKNLPIYDFLIHFFEVLRAMEIEGRFYYDWDDKDSNKVEVIYLGPQAESEEGLEGVYPNEATLCIMEKYRKKLMVIKPTKEIIIDLPPILILEAYLLYSLNRQTIVKS